MSLTPGAKLGSYEILAPIGAGGMGEVYKAKDTRLDRTVAIKVLPSHLADNARLRERFEREARAVSSLNHPHICTLYDIGSQDGVDFLVLEYLEGETLADRLKKGVVPLDQALRTGIEIADALDKAHRQGVVHRDLKPGNIMLTKSGAKLLDFGLAKLAGAEGGSVESALPTQQKSLTAEGSILGTLQYMAPEQLEGKEADARTDLFAFGTVLYEMVTGRRAFQGKSQASLIGAILKDDPQPLSELQGMSPPALDRVVKKCLAKDPEDRWQSARDLLLELKWVAEPGSQAGVPAPLASQHKVRERLAWAVAALAITIAVIAAAGWWHRAPASRPNPLVRLSAELAPGKMIDRFRGSQLALSPDGTRIVVAESDPFSGAWRLVMRSLDQSQFVPLSGTDRAWWPSFSPDGQWIIFFAPEGKLKKIPAQGGAPVTLCDAPGQSGGASWGDDGNIVAAFNGGSTGLVRVSSDGGASSAVTQPSQERDDTAHLWPQVLPGGQAVLFTVYRGANRDDAEIDVVVVKTGERKTVHSGGFFGRYLPSGHLVFLRENTLFAVPFDIDRLAVTGNPVPVLEEVNRGVSGAVDFVFSQTGNAVYVSSRRPFAFAKEILWLDSTGQTEPLHVTPGLYENPRFSPDGKRLAFSIALSAARADIWVKDLERDTTTRLTHLPGRNNYPVWTPDGQSIVFSSSQQAEAGIYWIRADGAGQAQRLTEGKTHQVPVPTSFSPDGKRLAYHQVLVDGRREISTVAVEGDRDPLRLGDAEAFPHSPFSETQPAFSPDGRWLAYSSNESGDGEVYVRPFPGPGGKSQVSTGGGSHPIWSRDGRRLFFLTPDWRIMVVDYTSSDSFAAGKPQVWSQKSLEYAAGNYPYDLAPDGKRFAVVMRAGEQGLQSTDSVTVLLNFFEELARKAPASKN